ncbi:unnamed protein product [Cochlearia groenlandica]
MDGLIRFGGLEEQFTQISESSIDEKIPFLEMLQCIEPTSFSTTEQNMDIFHDQNIEKKKTENIESIKREKENVGEETVRSEKRKRKRKRATKNKEEVENQRMTHIAVERNRRRQMNQHLNSLRSLMPPSFLHRGDQASIVGGAIDFIKELEQHLQSLESDKHNETPKTASSSSATSSSSSSSRACTNSFVSTTSEDGFTARFGGGETAQVEATVVQNHVSLKVRCKRGRRRQILRAIVSIENLKLSILHLTISSSFDFVFYSFSLKIEEGCKVVSADEIATAIHQIFEQLIQR